MITYTVSRTQDCFDKVKLLLNDHYQEISLLKQYPLKPNYNLYLELDKKNLLKIILCLDDNEVVGYIVFVITKHLHYTDCLMATEDIYYLKPEYRKGTTGIKMFKFAERYLKSINVDMIKYATKVHADNSKLFEYLGYSFTEKVYTKMLKD